MCNVGQSFPKSTQGIKEIAMLSCNAFHKRTKIFNPRAPYTTRKSCSNVTYIPIVDNPIKLLMTLQEEKFIEIPQEIYINLQGH